MIFTLARSVTPSPGRTHVAFLVRSVPRSPNVCTSPSFMARSVQHSPQPVSLPTSRRVASRAHQGRQLHLGGHRTHQGQPISLPIPLSISFSSVQPFVPPFGCRQFNQFYHWAYHFTSYSCNPRYSYSAVLSRTSFTMPLSHHFRRA